MIKKGITGTIILLALISLVSCSAGEVDVVTPGNVNGDLSGTSCLGMWQVAVDADTGEIDVADMRQSTLIMNVLMFLEPPALTNLSIDFGTLEIKPAKDYCGVDVILKHPLASTQFMGFDVRGVVFGPEVTNADGLTMVLNPEYFTGVPFGYQDGMLGYPASLAGYSGLSGYKYYCEGLGIHDDLAEFFSDPANVANRGVFPNGAQLTRHYDLSWENTSPPIDFFIFNYAVYANYLLPVGMPPYEIGDFDITRANSAEAFCASVNEWENTLYFDGSEGGGHICMDVEVWDWQMDTAEVTIEADGVIPLTPGVYYSPGSSDKSTIFRFDYASGTPSQSGDMDILITATDAKTFGEAWYAGLLPDDHLMYDEPVYNCWIHTTMVTGDPDPCTDMEPITTYEHFYVESGGPPNGPWQWFLPEMAGMTATRTSEYPTHIIGGALRYYPVTFWTFGAAPADAEDPIVTTVTAMNPFEITADIVCDSGENVYLVRAGEETILKRCQFDGEMFSETTDEHTFPGEIIRLAMDDLDNPIVLVKDPVGDSYTVYHKSGDLTWDSVKVADTIVNDGIRDFDYNPLQEHYVFVCSVIAIKLHAMDKSGVIQYSDTELFGTQPMTFIPSIYIDLDNPDCHIVTWGTLDSASTYARPIARLAAVDYSIPKTVSSLDSSAFGASTVGGVCASGTNYMFIPGYDEGPDMALGRITLPSDW